MRTIFAEYNPGRNSIDVYTSAGYMLRIDCWETEKDLKTTPGSDCALWIIFCKYCSHRILSPYRSINHQLQKSEAFQSVHHVTFILCYTVLYDFLALVFSLIRVCKHWRDDITQGKQ